MVTYDYDEGIVTYGALRILGGDMPYKDFWTLYTPGVFYTLAFIFKVFGISLKVAVLFAITVLALIVCSIYILVKKLCSRVLGILAFLLSLAWLKSRMVFNRPGQLAILFFVLCSLSLINFINSGRNRWLIISGILSGIIGLFRQDFGLYVFTAIFLVVLVKQLNTFKEVEWRLKLGRILKNELCLFFGFSMAFLPLLIYLILNSALKEFINDTVVFTVTTYPKVRDLPFPALKLNTLIFYLPLFVFLLACVRLLFYKWKEKIEDNTPWLLLFLLFSGLGLFNYTNIRTCMTHLLPTMIPAIILFILLINDFLKNLTRKTTHFYKGLIWIITSFTCFISLFYLTRLIFMQFSKKSAFMPKVQIGVGLSNINRAQGFYDNSEVSRFQALTIRYIQSKTVPNEKIFVGNIRHDKAVNNDIMFYFLSERNSATKYYELHPGLTNTQKIQKEIIDDLIKADVQYIILCSDPRHINMNEPNESSISSGVVDLDNFIRENYNIEKRFGSYVILRHI